MPWEQERFEIKINFTLGKNSGLKLSGLGDSLIDVIRQASTVNCIGCIMCTTVECKLMQPLFFV